MKFKVGDIIERPMMDGSPVPPLVRKVTDVGLNEMGYPTYMVECIDRGRPYFGRVFTLGVKFVEEHYSLVSREPVPVPVRSPLSPSRREIEL